MQKRLFCILFAVLVSCFHVSAVSASLAESWGQNGLEYFITVNNPNSYMSDFYYEVKAEAGLDLSSPPVDEDFNYGTDQAFSPAAASTSHSSGSGEVGFDYAWQGGVYAESGASADWSVPESWGSCLSTLWTTLHVDQDGDAIQIDLTQNGYLWAESTLTQGSASADSWAQVWLAEKNGETLEYWSTYNDALASGINEEDRFLNDSGFISSSLAEGTYDIIFQVYTRAEAASPVPIASSIFLLGSSLVGLVGFRIRFRKFT